MPEKNPAALAFLASRLSSSAKLFTGPVPTRDELEAILATALRVPDHGKLEPWRLIVLERADFPKLAAQAQARGEALGYDKEQIDKGRGQFDRGQLAVVVISSPKASDKIPHSEQLLSAGALCMNILTSATAAGWGANWLSGWPSLDGDFRKEAFGCAPHEEVVGIIHIATAGAAQPERPRPNLDRVIQWGIA